jgi:hypothetical protein
MTPFAILMEVPFFRLSKGLIVDIVSYFPTPTLGDAGDYLASGRSSTISHNPQQSRGFTFVLLFSNSYKVLEK